MAKKAEQAEEKVEKEPVLMTVAEHSIKSPLEFMTYDVSNYTGRVRMMITKPGNPDGREASLDMSRVVVSVQLPEGFDRNHFEVTGDLAINLTVKKWITPAE